MNLVYNCLKYISRRVSFRRRSESGHKSCRLFSVPVFVGWRFLDLCRYYTYRKTTLFTFLTGALSGLVFAPVFFLPAIFLLSILCYRVKRVSTLKQAAMEGLIFGFGHFLAGMYWIAMALTVYIEQFWWAIPFALCGPSLILACFVATACALSWYARYSKYYRFIFCLVWVLFEWIRSWAFTGFPWNLLAYSLSFSDILIQSASLIGSYGLSFIVVYVGTVFGGCHHPELVSASLEDSSCILRSRNKFGMTKRVQGDVFVLLTIITLCLTYGLFRLRNNPTTFTDIKVRLVQPSIAQTDKWDEKEFWHNFAVHVDLSLSDPRYAEPVSASQEKLVITPEIPKRVRDERKPDLIVWSESALVVPYKYPVIKKELLEMLKISGSILLSGSTTVNKENSSKFQVYNTFFALAPNGESMFEYHKVHLVPFGEYMPFKEVLPIKKLTHGFEDISAGEAKIVHINKLNLAIKPLICYESIFPDEARTSNKVTDVIINITNDAWYGNSSGPYQHFYTSRMRAVENGLPMIRVANNGISAIIDSLGRVAARLNLNDKAVIDGYLPKKLPRETIYSKIGDVSGFIAVMAIFVLEQVILNLFRYFRRLRTIITKS